MIARLFATAFAAAFVTATASAAVVWDEGVDGDLSNVEATPTDIGTLSLGSNTVTASVFGRDNFTFALPAGSAIGSIILDAFVDAASPTNTTSLELASGTDTIVPDVTGIMGAAFVGQDIIFGQPDLGDPNYSIQFVEFGTESTLTIDIIVVPEPASLGLLAAGALACVARRRRA
ncbi:MAG: PEP-CTERM sorting domain-containing protein [Planctomycetota bacterium]